MRILPPLADSNSMTHSGIVEGGGTNSTNAVLLAVFRMAVTPFSRFFKLIVKPERVRDLINTVLPRQFDCGRS